MPAARRSISAERGCVRAQSRRRSAGTGTAAECYAVAIFADVPGACSSKAFTLAAESMLFGDSVVDADVRGLLSERPDLFRALDGRRVVLTGGTGFVGVWLLRALIGAIEMLRIRSRVVVVTRDAGRFAALNPELSSHAAVEVAVSDIRDPLPIRGAVDVIVHAASETNVSLANPAPMVYHDVAWRGAQRVAELVHQTNPQRVLYVSSGAVYGPSAFDSPGGAEEDADGAPETTEAGAAYGNAKRACEAFFTALSRSSDVACVIARPFAFVGPDLPLRSGYAVGNFIADALDGGPIRVAGDGTPLRSYLYAADMALWLWTIALEGRNATAYNVGSETAISVARLAEQVGEIAGGMQVTIAGAPGSQVRPNRYVPSTVRARSELGLRERVPLNEALKRSIEWYRRRVHPGP